MKAFRKRFDLTNLNTVEGLLTQAEGAHRAIQAVEAGVDYRRRDMALATFRFLDIIGYYPESVTLGLNSYKVSSAILMQEGADYCVDLHLEGRIAPFTTGIFGSLETNRSVVKLDEKSVEVLVDRAFPKAQINGGTDVTMDDDKPHLTHLTIREKYMQGNRSSAPVAAGSATCSDLTIALMQATTRLIHAILTNAKLELVQKKEKARQVGKREFLAKNYRMGPASLEAQARAAYALGKEKYRKRSWVPEPPKFNGHSITSIWFDELVKPADEASDENSTWLRWSQASPDPVVPKPEKSKPDLKNIFEEALTQARDGFYKSEGKTPANILTWFRTEAYIRKVYGITK